MPSDESHAIGELEEALVGYERIPDLRQKGAERDLKEILGKLALSPADKDKLFDCLETYINCRINNGLIHLHMLQKGWDSAPPNFASRNGHL